MQKNSENFSLKDVAKLANSDAGKKLIALLQQTDPNTLQKAVALAQAGNYENARQVLAGIINSEEAKKAMEQQEW